jgi:uncharacterized protein YbjQ (UPF0145 family)
LTEKAREVVVVEAEKVGVKVPDLEAVKSDVQSNVDLVTSDLKSGAKELQSNVDAAISDLESGAEDLKANAKEATSKAEEVTSKVGSKAEEVGSDLKSGAEEAKSAVETTTESVKPSNGSAAPVEEKPAEKEVTPFFESDLKPVTDPKPVAPASSKEEEHESALSAFEGDEPSAFAGEGVGEDITAKKLEGAAASSPTDTSS